MLFYPSNLVVNIVKNYVTCQYLDLVLAMDDLTLSTGVIHYWTFLKKFHKFAYLNPKSNHPKQVCRGLVVKIFTTEKIFSSEFCFVCNSR